MREQSRERRHQEWLAHQAYSQFFASPSIIWDRLIDSQPHECPCGCGGVWYGPDAGVNMLAYLFPIVLLRFLKNTKALFPVFSFIYAPLWRIARDVMPHSAYRKWLSSFFQIWLDTFWSPVVGGIESHSRLRTFATGCTLILIGVVLLPVALAFWAGAFMLAWILLMSAFPATCILHIVSLALVILLFALVSVVAAIYVIARGLAFVVAGAASVVSSFHSEIGVALIVIGLLIEYALRFHDEKRHRYQLGRIIAHQQSFATTESTRAPVRPGAEE